MFLETNETTINNNSTKSKKRANPHITSEKTLRLKTKSTPSQRKNHDQVRKHLNTGNTVFNSINS